MMTPLDEAIFKKNGEIYHSNSAATQAGQRRRRRMMAGSLKLQSQTTSEVSRDSDIVKLRSFD